MRMFSRTKRIAIVGTATALCALTGLVPAAEATFPGENGKLAFGSNGYPYDPERCPSCNNPEHDFEIFTINPDGSRLTQLTFNAASDNLANWSPDGTKIAFRSVRDGNQEIYVMNADGSDQTNLTNNPAGDAVPSWSADGTKIYFGSERSGNVDVWVMDADGSGARNLTESSSALDGSPVESPDGRTVAFISNRSGAFAIYTMRTDGSDVRKLTGDGYQAVSPNWSPDGREVAFEYNGCPTCAPVDIAVIRRNGTGLRRLTKSFGNNQWPFWSPDGEQIAFTHDLTFPPSDIYTIEADGSGAPMNVTNSAVFNDQLSAWQPVPDRD